MAEWTRKSDGTPVLDTDNLQLNKSMRLMDTDLGQQLMARPTAKQKPNSQTDERSVK